MDTKKIEAFLTTIELGSMNKAAEKLNYTQTGLLYMIKTLEQELGTRLLIRTPQGVSLTKSGEELKPLMENTLSDRNRLIKRAHEISVYQRNSIRIAAYPVFMRFQMPTVINKFMADNPDTDIDMRVGAEGELLSWLEDDSVDLAIGEPTNKKELEWTHLTNDEIYVAIPAKIDKNGNNALSIDHLLEYTLLFSGSNPFINMIDELLTNKILPLSRVKVTSLDSSILLNMMENQNGIMLLSHLYKSSCPDSVNMHPIKPEVIREIGIITKKNATISEATKTFIEYLHRYSHDV